MFRISSSVVRACVVSAGVGLSIAAPAPFHTPAAVAGPQGSIAQAQLDAHYGITINGLGIGTLRFNSNVGRDVYTLDSDVELSALLGVFRWKGVTRTSGTIVASIPRPAGYLFEFASSSKSGSVKMDFGQGGVDRVSIAPPMADSPDTVPLTQQHLKGVLDPLSAIIALTHIDGQSPCGRRVSIFDGKQRFDLDLSYRRHVPAGAGRAELAIVCRVKYIPLGGHRANEETRSLARNTGIEITFRPVPSAKLVLPQDVVIPTVAGPVQLTLQKVDIKTPDSGRIAFVN